MPGSKNNPRNIGHSLLVIFIVLLDLGKEYSFVAGHQSAFGAKNTGGLELWFNDGPGRGDRRRPISFFQVGVAG